MRNATHHKQSGFTLVEMTTCLVVVGILTAMGAPTLSSLMQSSQSRSARNALTTSLALARMSAVSHQAEVVLCPSSDHKTCDDSIWWNKGWIVFLDINRDGVVNDLHSILQSADAQAGVAMASSAGRKRVNFRSDGSSPGTNLTFSVCDRRGPKDAASVVVSNTGRARQGVPTADQAAAACAGL